MATGDPAVEALNALVPGGVVRGGTRVGGDGARTVRWVEAGRGQPGPTVVLAAGRNDTVISWAPLLAHLLATRQPDLVRGLVLVDPAHLDMLSGLPRPLRWLNRLAAEHLLSALRALGLLGPVVATSARHTAKRFSDDPRVQSLVVDAYRTHAGRTHVHATRDEFRAIVASAPGLRRAAGSLPDVPLVVLSATGGAPRGVRRHWTTLQAGVAAAAPGGRGRHLVVADSQHNIHHDRPDLVASVVLEAVEAARGVGRDAQSKP
jgi:pimeloyl-ACP methyl ester carboxylesterase